MHKEYLHEIGLTEDQIVIYMTLLEYGSAQAARISILSKLKRSFVYKILHQLIDLGLAEKDESGKVAKFTPTHPSIIKEMFNSKLESLEKARGSLDDTLDEMVSKYNLISGKPNVQFFEGKKGLKKVYEDIISTKKDISLFRSAHDKDHTETLSLIQNQLKKQASYHIKTKAITPEKDGSKNAIITGDDTNLVERRVLKKSEFSIPAQIIVFGNKVGITSFKNGIFTTIIDNKDISESFQKIFDQLWDKSKDLD